jgi:hypothetical protein
MRPLLVALRDLLWRTRVDVTDLQSQKAFGADAAKLKETL